MYTKSVCNVRRKGDKRSLEVTGDEGIIWLWFFYSNISEQRMKFRLFLWSHSSQSSVSSTPPQHTHRWLFHHRFLYSGLSVLFSKSEVEIKPFHFPSGLMKTLMLAGAVLWRALPITSDSTELNYSKKLLNTMPWQIAHRNLCIAIKNLLFGSFSFPLVSWLTKCYFWVFICVGSKACYGVDLQKSLVAHPSIVRKHYPREVRHHSTWVPKWTVQLVGNN